MTRKSNTDGTGLGSRIMVTGGTGSFGQQFIRALLQKKESNIETIIIFSRDELKQYEMQQNIFFRKHADRLRYFIGDIRDKDRLALAIRGNIDLIVHTAALKQVPAMEYNPFEAVKTNILGSQNVIDCAISADIPRVVGLSTDKAAAPINLYGASKLVAEKLFIAANNYAGHQTKLSVVRYGNVIGSRGSVIPFFLQKRSEGVLPITDKRMTRFSITLDEGVNTVFTAVKKMRGGEVIIPKLPSFRILDLAMAVAPDADIVEIGCRPGEKLHEALITESDARQIIEFDQYYSIMPNSEFIRWDSNTYIKEDPADIGKLCPEDFRYNSNDNRSFLSIGQLRGLIGQLNS